MNVENVRAIHQAQMERVAVTMFDVLNTALRST
jgi:hypothetical protein